MTQTKSGQRAEGIIEIIPEEIDNFERQVGRFRAGQFDATEFQRFRLKQGVYGQRQPDVHMVRVKIPFGGLKAVQLDQLGLLAEKYAPLNKGHVTTRECVQFHFVQLTDTPTILRLLGEVGLTTREAAGNMVRNVTSCPMAGVCADEPFDVTPYVAAYARYFVRQPFAQALPRKIKTAFSGCQLDCAITGIHDIGFIPKVKDGRKGFLVRTGGGTSIMPRIAPTLYNFVSVDEYLKVAEAIIRIFNRTDELRKNRMKARLKFYVDRIGIDSFREEVDEELQKDWAQKSFDPTPLMSIEDESKDAPPLRSATPHTDGYQPEFERWAETNVCSQKQHGYVTAIAKLPLGDIQAEQFHQLADLTRRHADGRARFTQHQNITLRWIPEGALYDVWKELQEIGFGASGVNEITDPVACPGTDSCKLGITSSMGLARAISATLTDMDIQDPLTRQMHVKISGCPNGCGHHQIADIGLHGAAIKAPGGQVPAYDFFFGGSYDNGDLRIGLRTRTKVPAKKAPEALRRIIGLYQQERNEGEPFKDFAARVGAKAFEPILSKLKDVGALDRTTLDLYMDWDKTVKYVLERGEGECSI